MKNVKAFSSAIAMLICFLTFGQQKTVTGVVSDDNGTLPGANVVVKGTTRGVQTDMQGKYSIITKEGEILVYSFIGMKDQEKVVGKSNIINVKLENSSQTLQEVVVTSYSGDYEDDGYKGKSVIDKSAKPKRIESRPNASFIQTLNGQVSGVNISSGSANPGSQSTVVIRGVGTINPNSEPLYVIDGMPTTSSAMSNLDPKLIESMTVLKDASATQIYGNRGSNGVIVIKTSKGFTKKQLKNLEKDTTTTKPTEVVPVEPNYEDYEAFVENVFESPRISPLSTFSIDVDNASYTNIRRFINNGQKVPKDAVRIEEMVNFFKYQYPQPADEHPFSINSEYSDCPWNTNNKIVRIGLQGKTIENESLPASNMVFLIDVSGSMAQANKLPLVVQSLKVLTNQLRKEDKVAIVVYAGAAGLVLPPTSGDKKMTITDALDKLSAGGSTAGGQGITLAYKIAQENFITGGNNRVILATDGDFNVGASSDNDMQRLIEEKRKSGVFLTCLGYGMGNYKDSKMEVLANKGNGNYAYIDNIQEANRFLGKEFKGSMFAIAKDVKIQIEFNPSLVKAYRLIGYENRKLRPEDFKNDAIDAGELGTGHTVTALYEIVPVNTKCEFFEEVAELKYTVTDESKAKNASSELATIKFRYKKPDGDKSIEMVSTIANSEIDLKNASNDFKFCTAVAWFGLNLRDSKLVKNKSITDIKSLAKEGLSNDTEGYKAEFIRLVESGNQS
ncbi:YfbK domain-containing protein [Flavobacterium sp.]|uniref:YfbK domain-containing protein n=1 Tax=Flavobacterium sp. TaxID=239 RepID=UPI002B4B0DBD|nr:von Willebrand factor type A domain-containing protein [Flavobacterium sp.]HLP63000.1 von Willebrand factor type A domain-containing protein [Flavobacterium sp.]